MLHAFACEFFANFRKVAVANFALIAPGAHFDQRMCGEGQIDFVQHSGCEPVLAHHHDRVEVVRGSTQRAAGAGGEGGSRGRGHGVAFLFFGNFAHEAVLP